MIVAPAPITSEGNVGGQPTDLVFILVKDADLTVPGIALARGERLMVVLPKDFVRDRSDQVREDSDFNLVLTRGWPQASVPQKDQYRIVVDDAANANGDHRLDAATDRVVGGIIGKAPQGAQGQMATSPTGASGQPILSGEVVRDAKYPAGGGKPNPGLLPIQFRAGSMPGKYQPTIELIDGNSYQFTIQAE
jgi:hypothetical protein